MHHPAMQRFIAQNNAAVAAWLVVM